MFFAGILFSINRANTASAQTISEKRSQEMLSVLQYVVKGKFKIEKPVNGFYKGIQKFISNMPLGENGYYFIINNAGVLVHHINKDMIGKSMAKYVFFTKTILRNGEGTITYDFAGKTKVVSYSSIPSSGWILAAGYEVDELFFAPFRKLERQIMIMCLIGGFILAVVIFYEFKATSKRGKRDIELIC